MQLHRAVNDAEATCGLQFCVVVCSGDGALDDQVRKAFADIGLTAVPPVLVAVRSVDGLIEVELGPGGEERLSPTVVREVLDLCRPSDDEDLVDRAAAVVLTLADRAGPGEPDPMAPELPDVIRT